MLKTLSFQVLSRKAYGGCEGDHRNEKYSAGTCIRSSPLRKTIDASSDTQPQRSNLTNLRDIKGKQACPVEQNPTSLEKLSDIWIGDTRCCTSSRLRLNLDPDAGNTANVLKQINQATNRLQLLSPRCIMFSG